MERYEPSNWRTSSHSANGNCVEVGWRKSSYNSGSNCVEIGGRRKATASADNGECVEAGASTATFGVRDTKDRGGGILEFVARDWTAFLDDVKVDAVGR